MASGTTDTPQVRWSDCRPARMYSLFMPDGSLRLECHWYTPERSFSRTFDLDAENAILLLGDHHPSIENRLFEDSRVRQLLALALRGNDHEAVVALNKARERIKRLDP